MRRLGRDLAEIPLSVASIELWHRIGDLVDDDCGFECHGQIKVAESEAEFALLEARVAELRALVPALAEHCVGAIVSRAAGAANPYRTTLAFKRKAESLGVRVLEGAHVAALERRAGLWRVETADGPRHEAPVVVNYAGAWADRFAAALGEPVPLEARALMLMISARLPPFLGPVVGATGRRLSFKQFPNGTVLIGGGYQGRAERDWNRTELDFSALALSAGTVRDLFPIMRGSQIVRAWAGIEARMPDNTPVIGPSSTAEGAFHAFGFSGHGFQLGPIAGSVLAELVISGRTNLPIEPFGIGRFRAAPWLGLKEAALAAALPKRRGSRMIASAQHERPEP